LRQLGVLTNKHHEDLGTVNTSLHILVVDDRPDTVLFLTEFLLSRDHRVETCSNGNEALEAIVRRHRTANTYDLLISDVSMPGMDGITLLKEIRRRQLLLPVALYTAFGSMHPTLMQEAHQHDCLAVLDKPIELRRIDTLLSNVIARRDGTHHQEKDQPFFGTSRVARPSPVPGAIPSADMGTGTTGSKRRETAHPAAADPHTIAILRDSNRAPDRQPAVIPRQIAARVESSAEQRSHGQPRLPYAAAFFAAEHDRK
jgi:CheY-like chemotaxis protein